MNGMSNLLDNTLFIPFPESPSAPPPGVPGITVQYACTWTLVSGSVSMGPCGRMPLLNLLLIVLSEGSHAPCVPRGSSVPLNSSWVCGLLKAETSGPACTGGREPTLHFLPSVLPV